MTSQSQIERSNTELIKLLLIVLSTLRYTLKALLGAPVWHIEPKL